MKKKIIVIGAGLAGLSAAISAANDDNEVILVSPSPSERAQSVMAEGGINAALDTKGEEDSPYLHYMDTLKSADGLVDENAVWDLCQAAPDLVRSLNNIGVQFNLTETGEIDLRNFGGQKNKRTAYCKSATGKQIMSALIDESRKLEISGKIKRLSHYNFVTLILDGDICLGCVISDNRTKELIRLESDAVIIASGGLNGLFGSTTGSVENTSDVSATLFSLGVEFSNLEFVQYHPTTVSVADKRMLISEAARGEGGRLFRFENNQPFYFMEEKYPELGNLMPRDITSREVFNEGLKSQVYLDVSQLPKKIILEKLAELVDDCLTFLNIDITKAPIPISPGVHYFMGGIRVDKDHRTNIKNLYACGECCAQYHGVNRLGGNSLLGAYYGGQVAAKIAGSDLKQKGQAQKQIELPNLTDNFERNEINRIVSNSMTVVRNEKTLKKALEELNPFKTDLAYLAKGMIKSALGRKESRGSHYRDDYPNKSDNFKKVSIISRDQKNISLRYKEVPKKKK